MGAVAEAVERQAAAAVRAGVAVGGAVRHVVAEGLVRLVGAVLVAVAVKVLGYALPAQALGKGKVFG